MKNSFKQDSFHRKLVFPMSISVQYIFSYFGLKFTKLKPVNFIKDDASVK